MDLKAHSKYKNEKEFTLPSGSSIRLDVQYDATIDGKKVLVIECSLNLPGNEAGNYRGTARLPKTH